MTDCITTLNKIVFEQNYSRVFKAVFSWCGNYHLAEDATQEAFMQAFKNLSQLRDRENFSAWVYNIAVNIIKQRHMKARRNQVVSLENVENILADKKDEKSVVELKIDLYHLLSELDEGHKEVITLFFYFELPIQSISRLLGLKENTVKSRLYRAKEKMRNSKLAANLQGVNLDEQVQLFTKRLSN